MSGSLSRPVLHTERLRLEPLTHEHTELLVELDSDPEVLRYIFGRALSRDEVVDTYLPRRTRADADARGLGYWAGYADDEFLGWWCLGVDDQDAHAALRDGSSLASSGTAELGYRLHRSAWGRGYATEGCRALLAHAFDTVGLQRVWATTAVANTGSQRILEKVGLRCTGRSEGSRPASLSDQREELAFEVRSGRRGR